jgi:hypothetical protein
LVTGNFVGSFNEGAQGSAITVATFTDPAGAEALSEYSATIDWGDMSAISDGTITFDSASGTFTVAGSHTYAEEGGFTIGVTIHHASAPDAMVTSSATVADVAVDAVGFGFALVATEGRASPSLPVATFIDPAGAEALAEYSATIDWGDGTATSAGTITFDGNSGIFTVRGADHVYAEENNTGFTVTATIHHGTATDVMPASTDRVIDAGIDSGFNLVGIESLVPSGSFVVGTLTDGNPIAPTSDFSGTIDWGDGTSDSVTFTSAGHDHDGNATFNIVAPNHVYMASMNPNNPTTGTYPLAVRPRRRRIDARQ